MMFRLAIRSLATRPLRTAVLSIGFGLGIAVMAELLGVGEVILEQAHSPALAGGGDVVLSSAIGPLESARFIISDVLTSGRFAPRVRAASPSRHATVYLLSANANGPVAAHGGIPSRERAVGDPEAASQAAWVDTDADARWIDPPPGDLLRAMDRFHPAPPDAVNRSWAEWLYFNARAADGEQRLYLTFMTGAPDRAGTRPMLVRLQWHRAGKTLNFSSTGTIADRDILDRAPDVELAGNRVQLDADGTYRIALALDAETGLGRDSAGPNGPALPSTRSTDAAQRRPGPSGAGVTGTLTLTPARGRSIPPAAIHGAHDWVSGYVVPVLSGAFAGTLTIAGEPVTLDGMAGYHDHNWGYWAGVRWQWGQVASGDLSIVYGRVFPPADVADPAHVPGFLGVVGRDGPIAFSTEVSIIEDDEDGRPRVVTIASHDRALQLTLTLAVTESVQTPMGLTRDAHGTMNFLQLGGEYRVSGRAGGRDVNFTARGSAETFRSASP